MTLIFDTRHNFCFLKTRQTSYMILKKLKVQRCRVPRTAVVQSIRFSIQNAKFCWLPILPHTPCRTLPEACCILIIGNRLLGRQYLLRKRVESCSTDHPQVHAVLWNYAIQHHHVASRKCCRVTNSIKIMVVIMSNFTHQSSQAKHAVQGVLATDCGHFTARTPLFEGAVKLQGAVHNCAWLHPQTESGLRLR